MMTVDIWSNMKTIRRCCALSLFIFTVAACNQNSFRGNNNAAPENIESSDAEAIAPPQVAIDDKVAEVAPRSIVAARTLVENLIDMQIPANFKGGFEAKALEPNEENHIWLATANGIVRHLILENGKIVSTKSWTGATPNSGTRTYVLEGGGVILAKNGGHLYFLHDAVPEGAIDKDPAKGNYYQIPNVGGGDRSCVVSYRRDGKRYIGIAHGPGMFTEIEQENTPPFAPRFNMASAPIKVHNGTWGYSCFIDQAKLIFYSQYVRASSGGTRAIDLRTKLETPVTAAANAAFRSSNLPNLTISVNGSNNASYAMAGDRQGNVYNGNGYYTMAFEPKSGVVWASHGTNISIYPHRCLFADQDCKNFATYDLSKDDAIGAGVGPLSALGDGHMVGVVRNAGDIFLLKLKEANDPTKGIEAVKIVENLGGDPYMYTDFTGATLYLNNSLNEFDFTKAGMWRENQPLRQLGFTWTAVQGFAEEWSDIRAELRCYADPENKGNFTEVTISAKPKALQFIDVPSCRNQKVTYAELRLTQLNNQSTLMGVEKVQLTAFQ